MPESEGGGSDGEGAPEVKEYKGPWDQIVNRLILIAPWIQIAAILGYLVWMNEIEAEITVSGEIPAVPIIYGIGALLALTYVLALAKFFGVAPLNWIAKKIKNAAKNYNPDE